MAKLDLENRLLCGVEKFTPGKAREGGTEMTQRMRERAVQWQFPYTGPGKT